MPRNFIYDADILVYCGNDTRYSDSIPNDELSEVSCTMSYRYFTQPVENGHDHKRDEQM